MKVIHVYDGRAEEVPAEYKAVAEKIYTAGEVRTKDLGRGVWSRMADYLTWVFVEGKALCEEGQGKDRRVYYA